MCNKTAIQKTSCALALGISLMGCYVMLLFWNFIIWKFKHMNEYNQNDTSQPQQHLKSITYQKGMLFSSVHPWRVPKPSFFSSMNLAGEHIIQQLQPWGLYLVATLTQKWESSNTLQPTENCSWEG